MDIVSTPRIGFLGSGRMATALAEGLITSQFCSANSIIASDPSEVARGIFTAATSANVTTSNAEVIEASDVIVLAVKPQKMSEVIEELKGDVDHSKLIISIAAGVSIATFTRGLGDHCRIIRVMPNTPCLVGAGASAFALGGQATDDDAKLVDRMLSTVGIVYRVEESALNAVTGLSGSGPAYVYQMIEALSDAGVLVGLPREMSTRLAAQTLLGGAKMVLDTEQHPAALKDAVTSPAGTTIAGLKELEDGALRATLINAVLAATDRSEELGAG
ncbi:pyrroline-5-carboxylate reductase [Calycomorphotria hydatis]|uniref:Pyrroline-5-carboxylate reductase n=1 Tax=Calycomorphotria hydatis TaxID=2528027 RepID=A0A517T4A2_9PLAN|nr:pyrroline-5-carboxylate reductase [Calycomorphotria hydatis]QDT63198.1 Pyrroline-5-carboxylate reductase [Calycomorphotria hydatis]